MLVRAFALSLVLSAPAAAQTVSPGLELANPEMAAGAKREIQLRIEAFLKTLGARNLAGVGPMLAPKALIVVVRQQRDRTYTTTYQTREEFLAQLEKSANQPKFEEPIRNVVVTIDSDRLAYLRADFTIVIDGKVVSSGVDQFTLVKEPDGWKIAVAAFTSIPVVRGP
jgi:hypothetical protein